MVQRCIKKGFGVFLENAENLCIQLGFLKIITDAPCFHDLFGAIW
jgi:hypothetical protein